MISYRAYLRQAILFGFILVCGACSGGGGSDSAPEEANLSASGTGPRMMSYELDIKPIMQGKCIGCHNDGPNPLAPFSLEGADRVNAFKAAIRSSLENHTMPPAGSQQLSQSEYDKFIAWLSGQLYVPNIEYVRVALVEAEAWDVQSKNRDDFLEHRPAEVDCPRSSGWLVEDGELEVRTEFCNYLSLTQQSLLNIEAGTNLELALSYSDLDFNAPSSAHLAVSIGGNMVWETEIEIPSEGRIRKETIPLPFPVSAGDTIAVHLHNHGNNAWTLHSIDALIASETELEFCSSFDTTYEAIEAVVFEQAGCANSLCHGEAAAGGLDLSPGLAYANLVGAESDASSLLRVSPRKPSLSFLYHKLSAKTFPGSYSISGSPMPSAGAPVSAGALEAIRLWIEAGAPETGSVGDTLGRGEDEIERLLGVCLPEAEALNTIPLPPPASDQGVQITMPPHDVPAEKEREVCFAVYEDFRDVIPEEYLTENRDAFYIKSGETREDAFTHHNLIYYSYVGVDQIHDPSFGAWTCAGGENEGQTCEPTDLQSCGTGQCRAELQDSIACRGYGPRNEENSQGILGLGSGPDRQGFYTPYPSHGIFYWNSHAFNLTTEDGVHHLWRNLYFADDRRFRAQGINETQHILAATGTPPFEKKTECRDYVFEEGDGLLRLSSHTHKRGERFFMSINGEQIYETFTYDEPLDQRFEPALVFNSSDPAQRTLQWCATWNNGVNADGSPNVETVTRLSRRPTNANPCRPNACVAGRVGASCSGADDDASCDSAPGAGDGWCDACPIQPGVSSDDEMFILLGSKLPDHDRQLESNPDPDAARVAIVSPSDGAVFAPGETFTLQLAFENFMLMPPEEHDHPMDSPDHETPDGEHHETPDGDHSRVNGGHYHVYLDTEEDAAEHITAWSETLEYVLPEDIESGSHVLRVNLRAPDHHDIGVETSVIIEVE